MLPKGKGSRTLDVVVIYQRDDLLVITGNSAACMDGDFPLIR